MCDEPTFSNAKYKAQFEELDPLTVKGKKMPVRVCGCACVVCACLCVSMCTCASE